MVVKTGVSKADAEAMKKQLETGRCWLLVAFWWGGYRAWEGLVNMAWLAR